MSFNGDLYPTAGADVVMTTKGDVVRYDSQRERLGVGSTNQVLAVTAGLPAWKTLTTADSVLTTQGDVLYEGAAGLARLGQSTDGFVLTTKGASANPVWAAAGGSNVDILGKTILTGTATEIEVLVTQSNIPDDYAFFRVIGGGDTTGSCDANWTVKSAGSYITEYHQNAIQSDLGSGSDIYLGSDSVLELQSTAEINVARNFGFMIDVYGVQMGHPASHIWTWNFSGITGCINKTTRSFSCGTVGTGANGLEFDGCKIALSANDFEIGAYMTVLGFKSS
jgi:hypothetical protein